MFIQLFCLIFAVSVHATVFQMHSVDRQIKESDGIIIGHYLKSKSVFLDDSSVATQMIFKVKKEIGIQSELLGMDEVIVHYPGGKMGDQEVHVEGKPQFIPGEKVVLMIKSDQGRFWGMNLGFGTFKIVSYGSGPILVNTIFPEDNRVGQISLEKFEHDVRKIKGSDLKLVKNKEYPTEELTDRAPASENEGKKRAIASVTEERETKEDHSRLSTLWLVIFLAALGGFFKLMQKKES